MTYPEVNQIVFSGVKAARENENYILIDDLPPGRLTSSGILTLSLARGMFKRGYQVFVVTTAQNIALRRDNKPISL
jgi:hypothetical protein